MNRASTLLVLTALATASCQGAPTGLRPAIEGAESCPLFPANNVWRADVRALPIHPQSEAWLESMESDSANLHPDFGPSGDFPYGIPHDVIESSHDDVPIDFLYADESDPGPYPFGPDIHIEGGKGADGDRHALMIDRDTCTLYELFDARWNDGSPTAGSGAIFDLRKNDLRPEGWTSADAAGLPIFAGLVRLDEVRAGLVDHAIRMTAERTDESYIWPARHEAGAAEDPDLPPMGARFRLRADFDLSGFPKDTQTILRAMKKYGLMVADNGSNWYFTGTAEDGWPEGLLYELKTVPASAFEAVDTSSLIVNPDSAEAG